MSPETRASIPTMNREAAHKIEEKLRQKLSEPLPEPDELPLKRVVMKWYPLLKELREKGYTRNMLVQLLTLEGVSISKDQLSAYMGEAVREAAKNGKASHTIPADSTSRTNRTTHVNTRSGRNSSFEMRPDRPL